MERTSTVSRIGRREDGSRWWLTALGILLVFLGVAAIFAATLATVLLFGVLLLVGGVAQIAQVLTWRDDRFGWDLATGVLYVIVGGLLFVDPVSGAVGLTLLLAGFFLLVGLLRLGLARSARRAGGTVGALGLTGVLDLLLAFLILLGWPESAGWVIGLFLGIELVFAGLSLLIGDRAIARPVPVIR